MSTIELTKRIEGASPCLTAKLVGMYYVLTILTGAFILSFHGRLAFAADLVVAVFYIAVTAFFYVLSKPDWSGQVKGREGRRSPGLR